MTRTGGSFEKIFASFICICMLLSIAASCVFAENEESTAPEVNGESTATAEEPTTPQEEPVATIEKVVEEPVPTIEEVEESVPTVEEVVEPPAPEQKVTGNSAPEGSETVTPDPAEETAGEETEKSALPEESTGNEFDLEKAYEHYLSLEEEQEKEEYLNSLSSENQAALKEYIEKKEAEAAEADPASELAVDNENEENEASGSTELSTDEKEQSDASVSEDTLPEVTENGNKNSGDAEGGTEEEETAGEDTHISFGCAYISGEWFGRDTSTVRTLTILINIDGNLVDTCITCAQKSVADFAVYTGDNEIIDVTADYWELSGSGNLWSVDMYGTNNATVNVNMKSPLAAVTETTFTAPAKAPMKAAAMLPVNLTEESSTEEILSEGILEETSNEVQDEIQSGIQEEAQEEQPAQPSFEIRIPVTAISMNKEAGTAKLTIDASCRDMDGKKLDVKCISDHNFHFVYGEGKDSIEYGLYNDESGEKLGNGQTAASFTGDASANIYLKVKNGATAKYVGDYKDTITFAVAMVAAE